MSSPTWRATSAAVAYASAKDFLNIFNGASSVKTLKLIRAYIFNNGTSAVTGVLTTLQVRRIITSVSAGTTVTPVKHDTNSAALDANSTSGTNQTVTGSDIFRRLVYSNDEPAVSGATMDEWELLVPFAQIWDASYGDSTVEPIVCNNTPQGVEIFHSGATAVGSCDVEMEFINV